MLPFSHAPVLKEEILSVFSALSLKCFLDCTLGLGGHARAILEAHPEIKLYIGIDQDTSALEIARKNLEPWKSKIKLLHGNFASLKELLNSSEERQFEGTLIDLGVSSMQLDNPERGFSFNKEGPLDMRMDTHNPLTAADIVNTWSEKDLGILFKEYGEEKRWKAAAKAIVDRRRHKSICTTSDLVAILYPILVSTAKKSIHPCTLIFQALRIAVNKELHSLEIVLPLAVEHLVPEGRLAVISFHSLEDREVKHRFRELASNKQHTEGIRGIFLSKPEEVELITTKPIVASLEETQSNPRSRSAKLRVIAKKRSF